MPQQGGRRGGWAGRRAGRAGTGRGTFSSWAPLPGTGEPLETQIVFKIFVTTVYLCVILQKHCPVDAVDDMADEQQEDRGNEQVVEVEPLQDWSLRSSGTSDWSKIGA